MPEQPIHQDEPYDEVTAMLKAMADPNRLRILNVLMQGDSCNCELNDFLDLPPNLLSHHLRVLRQAGLINSRRDVVDGRWIYYAVDRQAMIRWQDWFTRFLDPSRIQERTVLCGPEGKLGEVPPALEVVSSSLGRSSASSNPHFT